MLKIEGRILNELELLSLLLSEYSKQIINFSKY